MCLFVCLFVICLSVKLNHEDLERQSLDNFISYPKELQHRLSTKIGGDSATDIIIQAQSDRDAARLRSLQGRGAGAWLDVIPTSAKYALKTNEFCLASYLRLGVALLFTNWIKKCDCGHDLDKYGYHLLTCKYEGGPVWSHSVLNGWSECLSDLHLPHQTEPRHQYIHTEDRPDITMFDPNSGQNLDIDVSLAHAWSQDIIRRASKEMVMLP